MKKRRRLPLAAPTFRPMRCEKGCGECCGPVPVTAAELAAVRDYIAEHKIAPREQGTRCPFYQRSVCAVYPVRPRVCQAYGHSERLVCSRGHNQDVDDEAALMRWVLEGGPPVATLHQLAGVPLAPFENLARVLVGRHGRL